MSDVLLSELSAQLRTLLAQGDYEAGFALGRHILRHYPRHLDTYVQMGLAALEADMAADAIDVLTRALSSDPESARLWDALARAARKAENETLARRAENIARELSPEGSEEMGETALAARAVQRGDWAEALERYHRVFEADPSRMDAALGVGTALFHIRQYDSCRAVANSVLRELPHALKAHLLLALCSWEAGDAAECERRLERARAIDPDDVYLRRWFQPPPDFPSARPATLPPWDETERWPA